MAKVVKYRRGRFTLDGPGHELVCVLKEARDEMLQATCRADPFAKCPNEFVNCDHVS